MIILTILLWTTKTEGRMDVQEIKDNSGFTVINGDKIKIVTRTEIILHIINPIEILEIIDNLSTNINSLDIQNKDFLLLELLGLKSKMKTITLRDRRVRRGLINIIGSAEKWLFGTMDEEDRIKIEEHLRILDSNSNNIVNGFNGQIRINDQVNKTLVQLKNIILKDRNLILKEFDRLSLGLKQSLYFDQLLKIQILKEKIENIQDNVASARHGILHPNILTDKEIEYYDIDFYKLQYIKLGIGKFQNSTLIFAIKVPKTFTEVQLKTIVPISNREGKEIDWSQETIFEMDKNIYKYEELKTINELHLSKHCSYKKDCKLIKNNKTEIILFDEETIIIKNAYNLTLNNTCDKRKLILSGNTLIHFNNCSLNILNHILSNTKQIIKERFYYPNIEEFKNFKDKVTFEEFLINFENNIEEIKQIKNDKHISLGINMIVMIILKLMFIPITIILVRFCIKKRRIQENSNRKGGEVMYDSPIDLNRLASYNPDNKTRVESCNIDPCMNHTVTITREQIEKMIKRANEVN